MSEIQVTWEDVFGAWKEYSALMQGIKAEGYSLYSTPHGFLWALPDEIEKMKTEQI